MKKKKVLTEVFVLFFIAAVFMAVYVVIEMGNDWLAVLGGALVLLIAAYLLVDYWLDGKQGDASEGRQSDRIIRRLDELEEVQKAMYTVIKRSNSENAQLFQDLTSGLAQMTGALEQLAQTGLSENAESYELKKEILQTGKNVLDAVKGMRQDYQIGVKNLIKYEKENAKQIAEAARTNTDMTLVELNGKLEKILDNLQEQKEQLSFIRISSMSSPFGVSSAEMEHIDLDREIEEEDLFPVLEDAVLSKEVPLPDIESETADVPETIADDLTEEDSFDAEAAIKAYMVEQGYVEEDEEPDEEPEEAPTEGQAVKSQEEIAETLQSMASGDPNRALTPEEIAAMFAAIQ